MTWWRPRLPGVTRLARGKRAEGLACELLSARGFVVLERNVRFPVGEIDIVAQDGPTLCFIEVRSKGSRQWGGPLESITDRKRRRLIRAAQWYLTYRRKEAAACRFDVVAIEWYPDTAPTIDLVRGAFTEDDSEAPGYERGIA